MVDLLYLILIPFIGSLLLFLLPQPLRRFSQIAAFFISLIPLILLLKGMHTWLGASIDFLWFPPLSIHFHLQVDNLSLLFLFLTSIIIPITLLVPANKTLTAPHAFYGLILLSQALLLTFFTARDLALFMILWESMLIPLYFIINIWGGPNRARASLKFLIYMIAGSTLMIIAVLALYFGAAATQGGGSFNMDLLAKVASSAIHAPVLCGIFLLAFAVKTPLFPFHAWLPDAYKEAPTAGTILLSALLSKAGIYGFLRVALAFFPAQVIAWTPILLGLAIVGVFYAAFAAWSERDFKKLIAYSSLSHVNFILVGLFIWNESALSGSMLQAFNHGITITALFLVAGWLESRLGSTSLSDSSGLAKFMPHLCWITLFFVLSSMALPGLNNFVGELLILFGLFAYKSWLAALLTLSVILSALYMLRWMQKMYFEAPGFMRPGWVDLSNKEILLTLPLIFLILWVGIYPQPLLNLIQPATLALLEKAS